METQTMTARQHRLANGFSIRELASRAEVSTQTIVSLEKGNPIRPQNARKIAEALGIEPMQIREYRDIVMDSTRSESR